MVEPFSASSIYEADVGEDHLERRGGGTHVAMKQESSQDGRTDTLAASPIAEAQRWLRNFNGVRIEDPYAWLEDPTKSETIAYLSAENAYREAVMAPTRSLQDRLYHEMVERIEQTDHSLPVTLGEWRYAIRFEKDLQYPILVRSHNDTASEEILLNLNAMVRTGYIELIRWMPDPTGRYLAYLLNESGGMETTLQIKDLVTSEVLPEAIPGVASFAWDSDDRSLFYVRRDDTLRPAALHRHVLGSEPATDPLVFWEGDPTFSLWVDASKDRSYLLLTSWNSASSEVQYLPADKPLGNWQVFALRRPGVIYSLEHLGDEFLILTNEDAQDFRILSVKVSDFGIRRELLSHQPGRSIEGIDVFFRHLVIYGREGGLTQVWIRNHGSGELQRMSFDEPAFFVRADWNPSFNATTARIVFSSPVTPSAVYEINLETRERVLLKQDRIPSGHDPTHYAIERLAAPAPDGLEVPISLVYRRDMGDTPRPTILCAYGAYGICSEPGFDPNRLSLIDRGMIFAIAHVRGGQELGRAWYEAGKLLAKKNSFMDFIACAEFLVASGRADPSRLVFAGSSAGGLLIGAVVNLRSELPAAVVAWTPFVDVLRVMADSTLPLTAGEYSEWGNPIDPVYREYIASYSPYDNVAPLDYPAMLISGGIADDQVPYWQPAKWIAKLRATRTNDTVLLLRMHMGAGHSGSPGRYELLQDLAHDYAFVLRAVGLADTELLLSSAE